MTDSPHAPATAAEVFISYSSEDRDKIAPIVQIVRAMKAGMVFQDHTSIIPGERWRERVMSAIAQAKTVIVFWCEHSAASTPVREEYEAGVAAGKEIVPILLDDTELPDPLRAFHWIDLRKPERHAGLIGFVFRTFRRSGRHYYPKDERGEYRDWDHENFMDKELKRKQEWDASQQPLREEMAGAIVRRLDEGVT